MVADGLAIVARYALCIVWQIADVRHVCGMCAGCARDVRGMYVRRPNRWQRLARSPI